jgi:predicted ATPase
MLRRFEARNFRMLRANQVSLRPFGVLVGQNATGKSTFLGALQFLADMLEVGVPDAVRRTLGTRSGNYQELCFDPARPIGLAVEVDVPRPGSPAALRYELEVGNGSERGLRVLHEQLLILPETPGDPSILEAQPSLFGDTFEVFHERAPKGWRKVVAKTSEGKDYFRDERTDWNNVFRFGPERPALGSLPEDPDRFPLSIATRDLLRRGIRTVALDATNLRSSSPPGSPTRLALDGSNLPDVARLLETRDPVLFRQWVTHVASGVQGLEDIDVIEREEDRHLVLRARFAGNHAAPVPSWLLSDGTLRLMALTLLSYAATGATQDVHLVEEPENGLHPLAIQAALDALSSPTEGTQVLLATHSPIMLAQVKLEDAIVFRRSADGAAIVRRGDEIPELAQWRGRTNLADLFATVVLA